MVTDYQYHSSVASHVIWSHSSKNKMIVYYIYTLINNDTNYASNYYFY